MDRAARAGSDPAACGLWRLFVRLSEFPEFRVDVWPLEFLVWIDVCLWSGQVLVAREFFVGHFIGPQRLRKQGVGQRIGEGSGSGADDVGDEFVDS